MALSGAPKGSLYHYFPSGKTAIAEAAVRLSSTNASRTLEDLAAKSRNAGEVVRAYASLLAGWIEKSGFVDGNSITTTLLEMAPHDARVTAAGREAFDSWRRILADKLTADGVKPARARHARRDGRGRCRRQPHPSAGGAQHRRDPPGRQGSRGGVPRSGKSLKRETVMSKPSKEFLESSIPVAARSRRLFACREGQ